MIKLNQFTLFIDYLDILEKNYYYLNHQTFDIRFKNKIKNIQFKIYPRVLQLWKN